MSQAGLAPLVSWPMRAARRGVWRGERPMRKIMIVLVASLRWLTPWGGRGNFGRVGTLPQVITFDGHECPGDHTHLVGDRRQLGKVGQPPLFVDDLAGDPRVLR